MKLGLFDSGIGGISILKEVQTILPKESFVYVADQQYFPYGEKNYPELRKRTSMIVEFLIKQGVDIVVVACNSATAAAVPYLRDKFSIPIVGTEPVVKPASILTKNGRIAILATPVTVRSKRHRDLIKKYADEARVLSVPCEELAESVEAGNLSGYKLQGILKTCLQPVQKFGADVLGLGCTHYPLVKKEIQKILGPSVRVLDPSHGVALHLKKVVSELSLPSTKGPAEQRFYTTGSPAEFAHQLKKLGLRKPLAVEKVVLYTGGGKLLKRRGEKRGSGV